MSPFVIVAIILGPVLLYLVYSVIRCCVDKKYLERVEKEAYQEKMRRRRNRKPPLFTDKAFRKFCRTGDHRYIYKKGYRDI